MKNVISKIKLSLEKLTDKMIPKLESTFDKILFLKLNDKGLLIIHWIATVLSTIFFINLMIGTIVNLYIYGLNLFFGLLNEMIPYNWFTSIITSFIIPILSDLIPYLLIRILAKLTKEKCENELDMREVLFATGFFLIITKVGGIIRVVALITNAIYRAKLGQYISLFDIVNPFINIIGPVIYIVIGLNYMKQSSLLNNRKLEEQY